MDQRRKRLYWEGSSRKDFKAFPLGVQKAMDVALFVVQLGGMPLAAKPWKGLKALLAEYGFGRRNG